MMIVDLNWVRMAKKRLLEIDACQNVKWYSNDQEVEPVGKVIDGVSNTDLTLVTKFRTKVEDHE